MPAIEYSLARFEQLDQVNWLVNTQSRYTSDPAKYGKPEFWADSDDPERDCDDYALAKMRALRKLGWPQESLNLATCRTEDGGMHAVLVAQMITRGHPVDYVLDNRFREVKLWNELPYSWIEISTNGRIGPGHWRSIEKVPA